MGFGVGVGLQGCVGQKRDRECSPVHGQVYGRESGRGIASGTDNFLYSKDVWSRKVVVGNSLGLRWECGCEMGTVEHECGEE